MERGGAALLGRAQQLVVRLHLVAREILVVEIGLQRLSPQQPPRQLHAGEQHAPVALLHQIIRLDDRCLERVGRLGAHVSFARGALLPGRHRHAGLTLELPLHALHVARRRERELQVGIGDIGLRAPEAIDVRRAHRQHALAQEHPLGDLSGEPHPAHHLVDGLDVLHACTEARRVVVAQVLAHARQRMLHRDAERGQQLRRADAGQLHQLRRVVGPGTQDHLAPRARLFEFAVAPAIAIADADCALALQHDLGGVRMRHDIEIRPPHRRFEERTRRTHAPAPLDRALGVGHAFLDDAVVIGVARDAERGGALDEGVAQGMPPIGVGYGQVAVAPAECFITLAEPPLHAAEIGKHVGITPAAVAHLRPGIEVHALAAVVDVAVDGARPAERLAARGRDAPAAGPFARLHLVEPVHARIRVGLDEAGRNMDERVPVARARFQHENGGIRVLAQPVGQHAARRSGADNHVVKRFHPRSL